MTEHHPNALAWRRPPKHDPFPDPPAPLVTRYAEDTRRESLMADKLEEATRRALENWLRGGRA